MFEISNLTTAFKLRIEFYYDLLYIYINLHFFLLIRLTSNKIKLCSVYCVMCMANPYREIMGEFRPDLYILQVYIYTVYCRVGWSVFGEKTATRQFVPNVLRHQFKIITFNSCLFLWRRASENDDWNSIHTTVNSPKIIGNRFA